MAYIELAEGRNGEAKRLARIIVDRQRVRGKAPPTSCLAGASIYPGS